MCATHTDLPEKWRQNQQARYPSRPPLLTQGVQSHLDRAFGSAETFLAAGAKLFVGTMAW